MRAATFVSAAPRSCARGSSRGARAGENIYISYIILRYIVYIFEEEAGKCIHKLQEITRNAQSTPVPKSSSRPFRRLRARAHAAALAAIRIRARAAVALVTAGVPLGAPHICMCTTQLVAHDRSLHFSSRIGMTFDGQFSTVAIEYINT
jgi:hypothetical protein